ncbi:MAG: ATP-grasp domain-containing protein [Ignavibacteria bacterium]|nr:ATP-grasp domain-containing protein [Ignavibacteria bacterium]
MNYLEKVILLDAHHRHSLAIIRSLGKKGIPVYACSDSNFFPARFSKYCSGFIKFNYNDDIDLFVNLLRKNKIKIIIASALKGNEFICKNEELLKREFKAAYNTIEIFEVISNKYQTIKFFQNIGIKFPKTLEIKNPASIDFKDFKYPVVFKSVVDQGTVKYANNELELKSIIIKFFNENKNLILLKKYPIIQEYIEGKAYGFFSLTFNNELLAYFMHERIHEVPPSGGPSAMAKSIYDEHLFELGKNIVKHMNWNGVAMLEFKKSQKDGEYYLIEINPKFWGSLDLAIHCGVDFPYLLYKKLINESISVEYNSYKTDVVFRWLTMDLAYSIKAKKKWIYLKNFFNRNIKSDFFINDIVPNIVLFMQGLKKIIK